MYTRLKNVQIILSILKRYDIKNVVLSPGGCDFPIIRSFESDDFFHCYSVVDESSSPYIAAGIETSLDEPVAVVCTSGTAAINFVSGIKWAYANHKRIVAITADRDPKLYGQMETQKIDQMSAFQLVTCYNKELPHVENKEEFAYCERVLNEALIRMDRLSRPVHINVPTTLGDSLCVVPELPNTRRIDVMESLDENLMVNIHERLSNARRILVVAGQSTGLNSQTLFELESFIEKYKAVLAVDHLSNIRSQNNLIHHYRVTELISQKDFDDLRPEIVITFGNNYAGERLKGLIRSKNDRVEHWSIDKKGRLRDTFYCLNKVFQCDVETFFNRVNRVGPGINQDNKYYMAWRAWEEKITVPQLPYSNFLVAKKFCETVEPHSRVYLSILMATRLTQFFDFKEGVKISSNVGALGIDGCASTCVGGCDDSQLCYLLVGDLSYFYDITSSLIEPLNPNIRIVLMNNYCGGEFHYTASNTSDHALDDYVAAGHAVSLKKWVEALGMDYVQAGNEQELEAGFNHMSSQSGKPVFFEIFTDADEDARVIHEVYSMYSADAKKRRMRKNVRKIGAKLLGDDNIMKIYEKVTRGGYDEESLINPEKCSGCGACVAVCSHNAIEFIWRDGFRYPRIDEERCIHCGKCGRVCEAANTNDFIEDVVSDYYAVIHNDEKERLTATSGAAFSLLTYGYINQGNVVYGAAFDSDWNVEHIRCTTAKEFQRIKKSKYVQSYAVDSFKGVEEDLKAGKKVLFSGTPCQCSGLKSYLDGQSVETSNLILIDIICHGVPSPELWGKYLALREKRKHLKIIDVDFRDKLYGWKDSRIKYKLSNGKTERLRQNEDPFLVLFFHNLILRECCYSCRYATVNRYVSDLTIGDFWGIWEYKAELYDDKGASVVMVNTEKGAKLFETVREGAIVEKISQTELVTHQNNLKHPSKKDARYRDFWNEYKHSGIEYVLQKYADDNFFGKIKRRYIYRFLWKIGIWDKLLGIRSNNR